MNEKDKQKILDDHNRRNSDLSASPVIRFRYAYEVATMNPIDKETWWTAVAYCDEKESAELWKSLNRNVASRVREIQIQKAKFPHPRDED